MRQRRWIELIKDYNLDIHYHPGKANVVADALSRLPCRLNSMILKEQPSLHKEMEDFRMELVSEGFLWYKGRICVPADSELTQAILKEAHDTLYSIHPGGTKM